MVLDNIYRGTFLRGAWVTQSQLGAERDAARRPPATDAAPPAGVEALYRFLGEPGATEGAPSLSLAHNCARGGEEQWGEPEGLLLRYSGSVVEVYSRGREKQGGGLRGKVEQFSPAARRNMYKQICATPLGDWRAVPVFSVLTYPYDCRPLDAEAAHGDLRRFYWRWRRTDWGKALGGEPRGFWNMEFTRRGAVHWNLLLLVEGESLSPRRLKELRAAIREVWSAVVNGRCGHEHQVRTSAEPAAGNTGRLAAYFAGYTTKAGGKEYQHQLPEDWDHSGRWWGRWAIGPGPSWTVPQVLQKSHWEQLRRVLRNSRRAKIAARRACRACSEVGRAGCRRCRFRPVRSHGRQSDEIERPPGLWVVSWAEGGWLQPLAALGVVHELSELA